MDPKAIVEDVVRSLLLLLSSCSLLETDVLTQDEACDLAQEWLSENVLLLLDGERVVGGNIIVCRNFLSDTKGGFATIDVLGSSSDDESDTFNASCAFLSFDQGWVAESCLGD